MKRIDSEQVKSVAKQVCKVVAYGALIVAPRVWRFDDILKPNNYVTSNYYDAVRAIMDTGMFASDKREAISALKRNGSVDYYKAVISIVNTGMFASDKIEMIKSLD